MRAAIASRADASAGFARARAAGVAACRKGGSGGKPEVAPRERAAGERRSSDELLAAGAQRLGRLRGQPHELVALVGVERGKDVAEELLAPVRDVGDQPLAGAGQ